MLHLICINVPYQAWTIMLNVLLIFHMSVKKSDFKRSCFSQWKSQDVDYVTHSWVSRSFQIILWSSPWSMTLILNCPRIDLQPLVTIDYRDRFDLNRLWTTDGLFAFWSEIGREVRRVYKRSRACFKLWLKLHGLNMVVMNSPPTSLQMQLCKSPLNDHQKLRARVILKPGKENVSPYKLSLKPLSSSTVPMKSTVLKRGTIPANLTPSTSYCRPNYEARSQRPTSRTGLKCNQPQATNRERKKTSVLFKIVTTTPSTQPVRLYNAIRHKFLAINTGLWSELHF